MFKFLDPSKLKIRGRPLSLQSRLGYSSSSLPPSQEHIARLILDQKTHTQALQTFKWASQFPDFTHSQSTYRALIYKLCTFRRFDAVHQLLDEMPHSIHSPPDETIFVTIVRGLGRARMIKDVIKVVDLVSKFHGTPSLKVFNSILDVLVKEDIDLAKKFYRKKMMASGVRGDDYTYGILMKGLCNTNRIADGFKLLQAMKARDTKPSVVIYNTLINALCKNGKMGVGRARSLMNEMNEPNDVTFNILISAYCKEENLVNAVVLMEKSFSSGFVPDVVTVTKVVELLCNLGRMAEAVEILERVERKGGVVDVVAYNTLIKGFCRLGKAKVGFQFLKEMERRGCLPNVDTYNALIAGFCDSGMLDRALDMFNDMKTDGISWNIITFDTLIKGLCSGGRMEDGLNILELMEDTKEGSKGQIGPYNSVLYGLYKENQWDKALAYLTKMEKLFPRTVDRSLRILGFCAECSIEKAKRVFDQMKNEGGIPSVLVFDCLIHAFCQEKQTREAFELMNEMIEHGYFPVASTFNALIGGFCRQGKVGTALKLLEDVVGRGCQPDAGSYSSIIDAFCRKGDLQNAIKLLLQMADKSVSPDYLTWNSLLTCLSQEPLWLKRNICHISESFQWIIET